MARDDTEKLPTNEGASTAQHITGAPETGTFITDEPPTSDTPANGSSNRGINTTGANRAEDDDSVS